MDMHLGTQAMEVHGWLAPLVPVLETVAVVIDLIGIAVILYGFAIALFSFIRREARRVITSGDAEHCQSVRLTLGFYILLGIEFMIASDIVHTVISRELGDLIFVAALVVIRTTISYFLGKELEEARRADV
ncbi:MAG: DUF1622 domain-containing protein [Pseudomonadota bacterium]